MTLPHDEPQPLRWWSEPCAAGCGRTIMVWAAQPGTVVACAGCPLPETPADVSGSVHYVMDSDTCRAEDGQA